MVYCVVPYTRNEGAVCRPGCQNVATVVCIQGLDFFQTESERLERLLSGGKVGSGKISEISQKLSVLTAFLPKEAEEMKEEATKAEE